MSNLEKALDDMQNVHVLTNQDISILLDALDEYRKAPNVNISELSTIGTLADKLMSWLSEVRFGVDLSNVSQDKNPLGVLISDEPIPERPEKDSLGKRVDS